jgi:hypothetical protein
LPELRKYHTWDDSRWRAALEKLPANQKFVLNDSLTRLLRALQKCGDPRRDGQLQEWRPSRWDVPRQQATSGDWVEYRLGDEENRARVIICFDSREQVIYLVARTVIHDHTSLRELVARFRS